MICQIRFGKVVAEPCTIQTIKVPNHNRVPTLVFRWLTKSNLDMGTPTRGQGANWHAPDSRLACPLGNAKDALDTIA